MIRYVNPLYPHVILVVPDQSAVDRYREWNGGHPEAELVAWAKGAFANPSGAFVDIGANCGIWTLHMAGAFSRVYAFEPNLDTFARLAAGVFLSNLGPVQIELYNDALGSQSGWAQLKSIGSDAFDASFVQYGAEVPGTNVSVNRLSDVLHDTKIALVKIDVEGFEYEVLKGAEQFLREASLPPILFESWDEERGQRPLDDTRVLLESYGYEVRQIDWPEEYLATRRT